MISYIILIARHTNYTVEGPMSGTEAIMRWKSLEDAGSGANILPYNPLNRDALAATYNQTIEALELNIQKIAEE